MLTACKKHKIYAIFQKFHNSLSSDSMKNHILYSVSAVQCSAIHAVQCCAVLSETQFSALQYSAVQCSALWGRNGSSGSSIFLRLK